MCRKVTCKKCGKASWAGCGAHVEQVLAGIAPADRCQGHANEPKGPGILARIFKR